MKTKKRSFVAFLVMMTVMFFSVIATSSIVVSAREREIVAVDSGNSFNMRINEDGVLMWDEVTGATGYKVVLLNSTGQTINEWDNTLTNNRVLNFISEMDGDKYDSGRYVIEVVAKDTNKTNSISYYYTSNVDKLEAPHNLCWVGNQAGWDYVDGAVQYELSLYNFEGLVARKTVTESPVDLSEYNPQDGWTFAVRAETNGTLSDKRNSNITESPKNGTGTRTIKPVNSGNALNMKIGENEMLTWDEVSGATGYRVLLKNPVGYEIYSWDNDFTNNYRMLPIITEMDGIKSNRGEYRLEVEPKGVGNPASMLFYYTSHVERLEEPRNLKWNGAIANWTAVEGAASYDVSLYDFNGQVKTATVTEDWYDFSEYNPQDGWTFKVAARDDGTLNSKRASNAAESPAKTTSYSITCIAYEEAGTVSLEINNNSQGFALSAGGEAVKNTEVTIKAKPNQGYEFVAWRITYPNNPESTLTTDANYTFKLTSNLHLFAVFKEIATEFNVTYHGNGASGYMDGTVVTANETYTLKDCEFATPYGKSFAGWAIGSADATPLKQPGEEITVDEETVIYAVWDSLYFLAQPTNTSGKIGKNIKLDVTIDLTEVPNVDTPYIVLETKNGDVWEKVTEAKRSEWLSYSGGFDVQQNSVCTKTYRYKIYNGTEWIESEQFTVEFQPLEVKFVDNTHSTNTESIIVNTVGSLISKPIDPTKPGYTFECWWSSLHNSKWNFETYTVTEDITLHAGWLSYGFYGEILDVYAKVGEKARIDLSNINYNNTFTYIYKYDGANWQQVVNITNYTWYDLPVSDVAKTETYKIVINEVESNEFTVTWSNSVGVVSFNANGGTGSISSVKHMGTYTLPECEFVAPAGKEFKCWAEGSVGGTQYNPGNEYNVTGDVEFFAIWEDLPTFIVAYGPGNGNGSTDFDYVVEGTEVTLLTPAELDFTPLEGMQFAHWKVCKDNASDPNAVIKQPGDTITITFETYIIAVWEEIPTFELVYGPGEGNGSSDLDYVLPGTEVTLQTPADLDYTPLEGMQFSHWKVCKDNALDPNAVIKQPGDTITITYNTYIIAVWTEKAHECEGVKQDGQTATCETDGWKDYYKCSCNKLYSDEACENEITDLEAWKVGEGKLTKDHEYGQLVEKVPATHTQTELSAGMEAHYYCEECGKYFDENKVEKTQQELVIAKPEHQYGEFITSDPQEHYKQCSCGLRSEVGNHVYTDEEDAECNICGHNRTIVHECEGVKQDGQEATCETDGWKDYYKCSCNKIYSDEACENEITDLEAWKVGEGKLEKGHSYGPWTSNGDGTHSRVCSANQEHKQTENCSGGSATCTEKAVCSVCNTAYGNVNEEHSYGSWTSNGDGTHSRVCSANQEHKQTENCSGGSATCTEKAVCSVCNTAYGNMLAHAYGSTYKSDANEHWNECSCGDKANKAAHVDGNEDGKCDTCNYQMTTKQPEQPKQGLSGGAIAGIVVGSVVVAGVGGFALFWFVIKKKKLADLLALFKKK